MPWRTPQVAVHLRALEHISRTSGPPGVAVDGSFVANMDFDTIRRANLDDADQNIISAAGVAPYVAVVPEPATGLDTILGVAGLAVTLAHRYDRLGLRLAVRRRADSLVLNAIRANSHSEKSTHGQHGNADTEKGGRQCSVGAA